MTNEEIDRNNELFLIGFLKYLTRLKLSKRIFERHVFNTRKILNYIKVNLKGDYRELIYNIYSFTLEELIYNDLITTFYELQYVRATYRKLIKYLKEENMITASEYGKCIKELNQLEARYSKYIYENKEMYIYD